MSRSGTTTSRSETKNVAEFEMHNEQQIILQHWIHVRVDPVLDVRLYRQPSSDRRTVGQFKVCLVSLDPVAGRNLHVPVRIAGTGKSDSHAKSIIRAAVQQSGVG